MAESIVLSDNLPMTSHDNLLSPYVYLWLYMIIYDILWLIYDYLCIDQWISSWYQCHPVPLIACTWSGLKWSLSKMKASLNEEMQRQHCGTAKLNLRKSWESHCSPETPAIKSRGVPLCLGVVSVSVLNLMAIYCNDSWYECVVKVMLQTHAAVGTVTRVELCTTDFPSNSMWLIPQIQTPFQVRSSTLVETCNHLSRTALSFDVFDSPQEPSMFCQFSSHWSMIVFQSEQIHSNFHYDPLSQFISTSSTISINLRNGAVFFAGFLVCFDQPGSLLLSLLLPRARGTCSPCVAKGHGMAMRDEVASLVISEFWATKTWVRTAVCSKRLIYIYIYIYIYIHY